MPRPKKFRIRRNVTLSKAADKSLRAFCTVHGIGMSDVVSSAILAYCKRNLTPDERSPHPLNPTS